MNMFHDVLAKNRPMECSQVSFGGKSPTSARENQSSGLH